MSARITPWANQISSGEETGLEDQPRFGTQCGVASIANGSVLLGRVAKVDVRLHWSALVGAFVFNGFRFEPIRVVCFAGIVLLHEVGHAVVVRACGATPIGIQLNGFGGFCSWRGEVSAIGRAAIAWGGVWAQLVLLGVALLYQQFAAPVSGPAWEVMWAVTSSNAWLIAVNLIPVEPLDGGQAWALPLLLGKALRRRLQVNHRSNVANALDERDAAFDAGEGGDEVKSLVSSLMDDVRKDSQ
ncbi:MAG: hypothetical protein JNG84_05540 [Archangium sp.]|nr:hypothetical protein [Archangium sp.]